MKRLKILIFFFLFLQKVYSQECYILNYGEGNLQKKFIEELKKSKNPLCSFYKEIKLTGDDIVDKGNLSDIKEGVVFCLTDNSARLCKNLKNINSLGIFISKELEYSKFFKVISFYPSLEIFFDTIKDIGLKSLIIIYSSESSERALHFFAKAKEKNIKMEPVKVEKTIDISLKLAKIIENYEAIIIPVDKIYFDKEFLSAFVEFANSKGKKIISFLDLFLDYGAQFSFEIKPEDYIKEAIEVLSNGEKTGLYEVKKVSFKEKRGGKK